MNNLKKFEAKKIIFFWKKNPKWPFFKIANSQKFFAKISQIRPWVSRIAWCEGHWCGSTYVTVRLSDISLKTAKNHKKCIFSLFYSLCRTSSRPYTLNQINALRIMQTYEPKDESVKFSRKNFENWQFWKMAIFEKRPFWIFF